MLSIKHILLAVGFLTLVFVIPQAVNASHVTCGSSWPSQGIECIDPARPIACGTSSAGVGQCKADSAIPNSTLVGEGFSCTSCTWSCPETAPLRTCGSSCAPRRTCSISGRITTNECTGTCGGCQSGWSPSSSDPTNSPCVAPANRTPAYIDFDNTGALRISGDITAGRICLSGLCQGTWPAGSSNSGGLSGSGTLNRIAKFASGSSLGDSNISDTGTAVTVSSALNVTGVANFSDDLNLVPGKGFRLDSDNSIANLVIANNGSSGAGSPAGIHATLHAGTGGLADLILQQGTNDRWALSVRPGSSNFEMWRRTAAGAWVGPAMAIDYATGDITLNQNVAVSGTLRGNFTASDGSACGTGQILKRTASGWACAADDNTASGGLTDVTGASGSGITVTGGGSTRGVALNSACANGELLRRDAAGTGWSCVSGNYYLQDGDTRNLTIGDTLFAYRVFARTGSLQLGNESHAVNIGGLLGVGAFRDASVLVPTPSIGSLFYKTSNVTTPAGLQVYTGTAWTAVGNGTTYTAGDYVTIDTTVTPNRISASRNGCFGPVFVGVTGSYDGDFPTTTIPPAGPTVEGYRAGHAICAAALSGSHMCSTGEILESISCNDSLLPATGFGWIGNGAPSLPTQTNDCLGWTYNGVDPTYNGVAWEFNANGGRGWAQNCNQTYPIACCR